MTITLEIPDELAASIVREGVEPSRQVLEDIAAEAYRDHRLTGRQIRELLGMETRYELDNFLEKRGVWLDYTLEDFRREGEMTAKLLSGRANER